MPPSHEVSAFALDSVAIPTSPPHAQDAQRSQLDGSDEDVPLPSSKSFLFLWRRDC
jgi:hypothetical protein